MARLKLAPGPGPAALVPRAAVSPRTFLVSTSCSPLTFNRHRETVGILKALILSISYILIYSNIFYYSLSSPIVAGCCSLPRAGDHGLPDPPRCLRDSNVRGTKAKAVTSRRTPHAAPDRFVHAGSMTGAGVFLFAGLNGDGQPILARGQRAGREPREGARRIVGFVEVYYGLSV